LSPSTRENPKQQPKRRDQGKRHKVEVISIETIPRTTQKFLATLISVPVKQTRKKLKKTTEETRMTKKRETKVSRLGSAYRIYLLCPYRLCALCQPVDAPQADMPVVGTAQKMALPEGTPGQPVALQIKRGLVGILDSGKTTKI
jgi:hypothetical protein